MNEHSWPYERTTRAIGMNKQRTNEEQYDKANHTDYLNTLKVYLLNNQNAVQTAKELFIHRGTILYRIKRICEIGQTNLSDPDELLHLYLSLRLMKQQEERKES